MEDFLLNNYFSLTNLVELISIITAVFLYKEYKNTAVKYFILFLFVTVFIEFLGGYTYYVREDKFLCFLIGTKFEKNHWLFTLFWDIGAITFFSFYYKRILESTYYKKIIFILCLIFILFSLCYIALNFDSFFNQLLTPIFVFGFAIIFLCSTFYFIETLQSDKVLLFYKSFNFYMSLVIFIWWIIITPITFYDVYHYYELDSLDQDVNYLILRNEIFLFANIFMYLTYTFALIWCRPEKN